MPLVVQMPRNPRVAKAVCGYRRALWLPSRRNAVYDIIRRTGLAGYEAPAHATILTIMERAPRGAVFIDVGAHIGLYSATVAAVYHSRKPDVYAFEPTPLTARLCREVRDRNGLMYEIVEAAVSDRLGTAELYLSPSWESSNSLNPLHRDSTEAVTVSSVNLDTFCAERGIEPYLVKIDVETVEPQVLAGALTVIDRSRPWITCELLADTDRVALASCLWALARLGYTFHRMSGQRPWPPQGVDECLDLLDNTNRDWLFAPRHLGPDFYQDLEQWLLAIAECDASTNVPIAKGTRLPAGWASTYCPAPPIYVVWRRLGMAVRNPSLAGSPLRQKIQSALRNPSLVTSRLRGMIR